MSKIVTRSRFILRFDAIDVENADKAAGDDLIILALRLVLKACFKGNLAKMISAAVGRLVGSLEGVGDGNVVGTFDGFPDGLLDGPAEGIFVG